MTERPSKKLYNINRNNTRGTPCALEENSLGTNRAADEDPKVVWQLWLLEVTADHPLRDLLHRKVLSQYSERLGADLVLGAKVVLELELRHQTQVLPRAAVLENNSLADRDLLSLGVLHVRPLYDVRVQDDEDAVEGVAWRQGDFLKVAEFREIGGRDGLGVEVKGLLVWLWEVHELDLLAVVQGLLVVVLPLEYIALALVVFDYLESVADAGVC